MKYYSEKTKKFYDTEQALLEDERQLELDSAEMKRRNEELHEAYEAYVAAGKRYNELMQKYFPTPTFFENLLEILDEII